MPPFLILNFSTPTSNIPHGEYCITKNGNGTFYISLSRYFDFGIVATLVDVNTYSHRIQKASKDLEMTFERNYEKVYDIKIEQEELLPEIEENQCKVYGEQSGFGMCDMDYVNQTLYTMRKTIIMSIT